MAATTSHLLSLPIEVRNRIYFYAISPTWMDMCTCLSHRPTRKDVIYFKQHPRDEQLTESVHGPQSTAHGVFQFTHTDVLPSALPYVCSQTRLETQKFMDNPQRKKMLTFCSSFCFGNFLPLCRFHELVNLESVTVWSISRIPPKFYFYTNNAPQTAGNLGFGLSYKCCTVRQKLRDVFIDLGLAWNGARDDEKQVFTEGSRWLYHETTVTLGERFAESQRQLKDQVERELEIEMDEDLYSHGRGFGWCDKDLNSRWSRVRPGYNPRARP